MAPTPCSIIVFLLGCVAGWYRRSRPARGFFRSRELRVAAHEAGHAMIVHRSPCERVISVEITEPFSGSGKVISWGAPPNTPEALWWGIAIQLGGFAGELAELKSFRSGNCKADLVLAREYLTKLDKMGATLPPWPIVESASTFDVTLVYRLGSLTKRERIILRHAYAHARGLIERDLENFRKLAQALVVRGHLDGADVARLLR